MPQGVPQVWSWTVETHMVPLYKALAGHDFHISSEFKIVRAIKEVAAGFLSICSQRDEALDSKKAPHMHPDGSNIELEAVVREGTQNEEVQEVKYRSS
ncbi:hypothetical protein JZ751_007981 [Albula glossodonta]|uniref:Uncharacterized protein n=1 Tax=Albula glossodonta TaxID=121402 RepID=A0A8T2NYK6_9TELE|nr:hypothetical protein JZ751_007981 [Albula glossodonta]